MFYIILKYTVLYILYMRALLHTQEQHNNPPHPCRITSSEWLRSFVAESPQWLTLKLLAFLFICIRFSCELRSKGMFSVTLQCRLPNLVMAGAAWGKEECNCKYCQGHGDKVPHNLEDRTTVQNNLDKLVGMKCDLLVFRMKKLDVQCVSDRVAHAGSLPYLLRRVVRYLGLSRRGKACDTKVRRWHPAFLGNARPATWASML